MKPKPSRTVLVFLVIYLVTIFMFISRADAQVVQASLPCKQYHGLLREYGLPVKTFAPIMYRESRCQPKAIGWNYHKGKSHRDCRLTPARTYRKCRAVKSWDSGLLQINSSWRTVTYEICDTTDIFRLLQPRCNLAVARYLYADGKGLSNWSATSRATISDNRP